mmetsp:Transcript_9113/g.18865  ORF Transcript_9113/g.18865 Transcript_9113/m.18865 type:complete len:340 (-) Transcript_9113:425-1444(-)|eukprot:CAMPEP_0118925504 /NCGR_PEP_ID=MMETSP1169-20130426/3382_1 /TAXON_ID=36882 /ORGANISM="Pyramimonas obovata, Strain CCMP722" /LENGTH=339 /DNA_ID=CAMNT_0006866821 /DNA_START=113 /DNA_END=1132 /DNA_ORIENTATION=-
MATQAVKFSSPAACLSSRGLRSANSVRTRAAFHAKRTDKAGAKLARARTFRVLSTAAPEMGSGEMESDEVPAFSTPPPSMFVTEEDRRSAAKVALYDVLPEQSVGSADNAIKEAVGERLLVLEHMCPVSNPAAQSLDGTWEVLYCDTTTPGLLAARALLSIPFPKGFAEVDALKLVIEGEEVKAVANVKLLNGPYATINLVSSINSETDIRVRESYVKGTLSMPELGGEPMMDKAADTAKANVPEVAQKAVLDALSRAAPLLQNVGKGIEVPLTGSYERVMLISYLDDDLMVARNVNGTPEILRKIPEPVVEEEVVEEKLEEVIPEEQKSTDIEDELTL